MALDIKASKKAAAPEESEAPAAAPEPEVQEAAAAAPKEPRRIVLDSDMAVEIAGVSVDFKAGVPKAMWRSQRAILDKQGVEYTFKD